MSTRSLLVIATLVALIVSCSNQRVRNAPFRDRPDSVAPGSLLGPFTGRVVDDANGDPVTGALVYAAWSFEAGYGLTTPAGHEDAVVSTDADGRYEIKALGDGPGGGSARVTNFVLVIYKRGYVGYRSDRRFGDFGLRRDFAQRQNQVVLPRWRAEFSHVKHLRYLGGGGPIAALTSWEADEAAAELSGMRGLDGPVLSTDITPTDRRTVAAQLLSEREIVAISATETKYETGPLGDEPDSDRYSSQHFRAVGQPESFDVALRMWTEESDAAEKRYQELIDSLPKTEVRDEIADQSFRAEEGQIVGVAFLDKKRGVVVLLTCGISQCESVETAVSIGRKIFATLEELEPLPQGAAP